MSEDTNINEDINITEDANRLPVVAIVGRPNVGKSALFNRLAGSRIAIVHSQSGITRDRLMMEVLRYERSFLLIDTGGISMSDKGETQDFMQSSIHRQVQTALEDADCVIFMTDLRAGVVPLDQEVARFLHTKNLPVAIAANKADIEADDTLAPAFEELGFPVVPISAMHNRNIDELMEKLEAHIPITTQLPPEERLRVTIAGRPNVGKSSFINAMLKDERLIVSDVAGTTHDSIDIPFSLGEGDSARHYTLVDTPGIRKGGKIHSAVDKFGVVRAQKSIKSADICVLIMDAVQGPTAYDKKIADFILRNEKGCVLIINKWDLSEDIKKKEYAHALQKAVPFLRHCPVVFTSSLTGSNVRHSIEMIEHVAAQVVTRIPTSILNKTIEDAEARVSPPAVKGRKLHAYYAVQTDVKPLKFTLFVNNPKLLVPNYSDYLIKCLRRKFGLEGAPIVLLLRNRPKRKR
jgi:GTP-binding protein